MKPEPTVVTVTLAGGKTLSFETGKIAKQAHGSAVVRLGENVVLATATANPDPREGVDFFPLTVDYREYTYAGGRFPGGFIKREGRMSEKEVLTSRQIDRPIRPMFAEGFKCETQVIALVLSADSENDPDVCAINGASAALHVSNIPFLGPIGAVRVGLINGQFIVNPTYNEMRESLLNIMLARACLPTAMIVTGPVRLSARFLSKRKWASSLWFGCGSNCYAIKPNTCGSATRFTNTMLAPWQCRRPKDGSCVATAITKP